jgi:hypothetical protein
VNVQDPKGPIGAGSASALFQPPDGGSGDRRSAQARRGLEELGDRPRSVTLVFIVDGALGAVGGLRVAAKAVVQDGRAVAGEGQHASLTSSGRALEGELTRVALDSAPCGKDSAPYTSPTLPVDSGRKVAG